MSEQNENQTPIGKFGKFGLISHLTKEFRYQNKTTIHLTGDDAALTDPGNNLTVVTTDLLLEGIHFNLVYTPLRHLGYKSVIRAISDIYAMNGVPGQVLVALGISSRFTVEKVVELYEGIRMACERYGVDLAGGDMTSSLTGLTIGVTATGIASRDGVVKRSGAKANDIICVTGNLGAAFAGLQILERERRLFEKDKNFKPDLAGYEYVIERQLKPEFPSALLDSLRERGLLPTSMIDISEGLASDLLHICKLSGTGCRIYYEKIPVDTETARVADELGIDPLTLALNGGEDYELLFTVPLEDSDRVRDIENVSMIGHLTIPGQGYVLVGGDGSEAALKAQGWETDSPD